MVFLQRDYNFATLEVTVILDSLKIERTAYKTVLEIVDTLNVSVEIF